MKRQHWFGLIVACIFLVAAFYGVRMGTRQHAADSAKPIQGFPAPNFTLNDLNSRRVELKKVIAGNKVTLINFWATWCPPCRAEIPELVKFYQKYSTKGVTLLAINERDQSKTVKDFAAKAGMKFPVLTDTTGKVGELYQIFSIPGTFIVDQKGTIRTVLKGATNLTELEKKVQPLLK